MTKRGHQRTLSGALMLMLVALLSAPWVPAQADETTPDMSLAVVRSIENNVDRLLKYLAGTQTKAVEQAGKDLFAAAPGLQNLLSRAASFRVMDQAVHKLGTGLNSQGLQNEIQRSLFTDNSKVPPYPALLGKFQGYCNASHPAEHDVFACPSPDGTYGKYGLMNFANFLSTKPLSDSDNGHAVSSKVASDLLELFFSGFNNNAFTLLSNKNLITDANSAKTFVGYLQKEALVSPAKYSLLNMYNARQASSPDGQDSLISLMEKESNRRYLNPEWQAAMATLNTAPLLRELATMEAYKLWMDQKRYLQMERIEALLATMVLQNTGVGKGGAGGDGISGGALGGGSAPVVNKAIENLIKR